MTKSIQSVDDAADTSTFAHVGMAELAGQQVVVKLMLNGHMAQQEKKTLYLFREKPHTNIVQGLCAYECNDNPIRWQSRVNVPQPFCVGGEDAQKFVVVVQEFIPGGTLADFTDMNSVKWRSITLQLTFACLEWYESYNYLYMDWHSGNVLMDTVDERVATYEALGEKWVVSDLVGIRPVITDFSRGVITATSSELESWTLASQLGIIWDMMKHTAPSEVRQNVSEFSIKVGECEEMGDLITVIKSFVALISPPASKGGGKQRIKTPRRPRTAPGSGAA